MNMQNHDLQHIKRKLMFVLLAFVLVASQLTIFAPIQQAFAASAVQSTVNVSAAAVKPGDPIDLTIVAASDSAKKLIFQLQVIGPGGSKAFETLLTDQDLPGGTPKTFAIHWVTPASLPSGNYTVSLGVFGAGWSEMYSWDWGLASFTVTGTSGGGGGTQLPVFSSSADVPTSVTVGGNAAVSATLKSDKAAIATLKLVLHDPAGRAVHEKTFAGISFESGTAKSFDTNWNVPVDASAGTYTVQATVTSADGTVVYHRNTGLGTFAVKADNPAESATYTTQVSPAVVTVKAGDTANFTAKVTSSKNVSALVDIVITDPYTGKPVYQKVLDHQSFTADTAKEFALSWDMPSGAAAGSYPIQIGIFGNSWEGPYTWNSGAGTINVTDGTAPQVEFTSSAQVSGNPVQTGNKATVQLTATSSINISGLVQLKVKNAQGTTVFSKEFANEYFVMRQPKALTAEWTVPGAVEAGEYSVDVAVYSTDRKMTYHLHENAAQFSVTTPPVEPEQPDYGVIAKWSSAATIDATVEAGYAAALTAEVVSDVDAQALVDVEIYKGSQKVQQFVLDNQWFKAGVPKQFPFTWDVPVMQERGDYSVKIGVFPPGWKKSWEHDWNNDAASFQVSWGVVPDISLTGSVSSDTVQPGQQQTIETVLTSSESIPAVVTMELFDSAGNRVVERRLADESFVKDVPNRYSVTWTVPEGAVNGTYALKVTVAKSDGVRVFYVNPEAAKFQVTGGLDMKYTAIARTEQAEVSAGETLNVHAQVGSTVPSRVSMKVTFVDVLTGKAVHTETLRDQAVSADQTAALSIDWTLPKWIKMDERTIRTKEDVIQYVLDGDYKINVELYNPDMSRKLLSEEGAASFKVVSQIDPPAPKPAQEPALPEIMKLGVFATNNDDYGVTGWMPQTGAPWNFAYRYLNGGVNNENGWRYWDQGNVGTFEGAYAYDYAKKATDRGYTPVLTFYQMLQSISADCIGCDETKDDIITLNDPYAMRAYFEEFKLLMQLIGTGKYNDRQGIGKTAVVHVDPDLAGYAEQAVLDNKRCFGQCTAQGNDPSFLKAAVSSTRMPELEGLPDTFQGYNYALLRLRDMYAPNVLMAPHVNSWGTLQDVGKSTDPTLDVYALGKLAGEFAAKSGTRDVPVGIKPYDFIFNDIDDQDSGATGDWLDRTNLTLPNFHRWEQFVKGAVDASGKKVMIWQIPVGNQVYRTMDNTPGHWQDNKAEYLFGHMQELVDVGIVGLMFGHGQPDSTAHYNKKQDETEIYNPEPLTNITKGWGDGSVHTNDKTAVYSDDDGGYLREQAIEYYKNPIPVQNKLSSP